MERKLIVTEDGSHTLYVPELNEHYHSIHGALQESQHVFIESGLHFHDKTSELSIFEAGFGTGLNAFLTFMECEKLKLNVSYTTIEKYPITPKEIQELNYKELNPEKSFVFKKLHEANWGKFEEISTMFRIKKIEQDLVDYSHEIKYDIIYFDAFAPDLQPNLWSSEVFTKLYENLNKGGLLVTYSAKGFVKRNLKSAGFNITKIPGPPGKREMVRAYK